MVSFDSLFVDLAPFSCGLALFLFCLRFCLVYLVSWMPWWCRTNNDHKNHTAKVGQREEKGAKRRERKEREKKLEREESGKREKREEARGRDRERREINCT
jgi:uncharacterized membrane protein